MAADSGNAVPTSKLCLWPPARQCEYARASSNRDHWSVGPQQRVCPLDNECGAGPGGVRLALGRPALAAEFVGVAPFAAPAMFPRLREAQSQPLFYPTAAGDAACSAARPCGVFEWTQARPAVLRCPLSTRGVWGKGTMPLEIDPERIWMLSENRRQVVMELPPLLLPGQDDTVVVRLRFDAEIIDGFLQRLTLLRSRMLPAPATQQPR